MSAFIKYFNCFFIQFFGLRVIYFILNILIMGSFFSTEDRHFFVLRQKQRTLGKLAICIYFSFLFLQGKILIVISQLSSDDFRLSLKQLNYVRIMLFQLFDKNQQDQEEAFTVFLKPNIKHLFQLLMLRSARFNKDTINKTTTKCSYVVLKLYFLIVVLIAHFGQSMPVSQPYLALDHHYVLQVDRAVNHFMLLEDRKTLEEGEKGVNDLLFRKLAVRASSLSYFDLFQKRGLLFGVEDTLVESDAFQQIGMRNLFFGVLRRVEVTVEFARLFVHEENFLGLVFYQCERMGIKFPHLFLFIIFMFHKRYKDSRQITCVKLAIDFADLQFFAKVAYLFKIYTLQKAPNMLLNAHGSN